MMANLREVGFFVCIFIIKGGIANLESSIWWRLVRRLRSVAKFAKEIGEGAD